MRRWAVLTTLALVTAVSASARGEPAPADRAAATALFEQGRELLVAGKISDACARFAESQRLDPSLGTLLNLANCHELDGKTATAWSELHEALAIAEREHQSDRVAFARTHIAALEPKLPRLVVTLPRDLDAVHVEIRRDGSLIGRVAAASAAPVDPGPQERSPQHRAPRPRPASRAWCSPRASSCG